MVSPVVSLLGANLSDNFPWLRYVPDKLRRRLTPTLAPGDFAPGPVLILLYAGRDDPLSFDSCVHAHYPRLSPHIVAFDTFKLWGKTCWLTSHMGTSAKQQLMAESG